MSGADEPESQEQIISGMKESYPDVCDEVFVASDTWGALFTATASGKWAPLFEHHVHPKNSDRQALANSVDTDQMPQNVTALDKTLCPAKKY